MPKTFILTAQNVINREIEALELLKNRLGTSFISAVNILSSANKVIVSGVGKSGIISQKIASTLTSTGTPAVFLHPVEALHGDIGIVQAGDAALFLSKSGNTDELLKLLPWLKSRSIPIIGILGNIHSPLAQLSTIALDASVANEGCPIDSAPMASAIAALALGDALAAVLMREKKFSAQNFAGFHPLGQLGRNLSIRVSDIMHDKSDMPQVSPKTSFREAVNEISAKNLGCACVIQHKTGKLLGIITDGDVRRALQTHDIIISLKAENVMTAEPIFATPEMLVGEALSLMENRERQISVLPVVSGEKCVGVVRVHDIVRLGIN